MRRGSCFSLAALLLVAGTFMMVCGGVGESRPMLKAGAVFLGLAVAFFLAALFVRWQGWGN